MTRNHRTKTKDEAHKRAVSNGRPPAKCGPGAPARGKAARAASGANGGNGAHGGTPKPQPRQAPLKPSEPSPAGQRAAASNGGPGGGPMEEPLQKGDMVVIRMRSDWELEGELRAINDEVVRIFDFAVCDVLRLRRKDIARIERLVDAD